MPIYKTKNENFFKEWSSRMAYILGFFVADGSMIRNKRGAHFIEFTTTDRDLLESIKKTIKSNLKLGSRKRNINWKQSHRLQIGSKIMFNDLMRIGLVQNKTKVIDLPNVPKKYFRHFVRGYFDGDGSVSIAYNYKKNRSKPTLSLLVRFTSGSERLLSRLKNTLCTTLDIKGSKGYFGGAHRLSYSINDSVELYHFMYDSLDNNLFLERKKRVFEKFLDMRA